MFPSEPTPRSDLPLETRRDFQREARWHEGAPSRRQHEGSRHVSCQIKSSRSLGHPRGQGKWIVGLPQATHPDRDPLDSVIGVEKEGSGSSDSRKRRTRTAIRSIEISACRGVERIRKLFDAAPPKGTDNGNSDGAFLQ